MFHKWVIALSLAAILSLFGGGQTFASYALPSWETAFDPGPYMPGSAYIVNSVEEYKGNLYIVAGDPGWFYSEDDPRISAGQVFRSPDGKSWQPASDLGFGLGAVEDACGTNYYDTAQDMTVFNNQIYVLPFDSCYTRPGPILRSSDGDTWESVTTTEEFGLTWTDGDIAFYGQFHKFGLYKGMLYASIDSFDPVTQFTTSFIYRSPNGNPGTWQKVIEFPGWGWPGSFQEFKGALYVASDGRYLAPDWERLPEQIWRTYDGLNWEAVVADGFGNPGIESIGGFAEYKGYLYIGDGVYGIEGYAGQVWRSQDGLNWESVVMDGFGSPGDVKVDGLVVYLGDLYAYTVNWDEGGSVFRTSDAVTWERVSEPGWGNPTFATSHLQSDQAVFHDDLYMGVVGMQGVLLKLPHPNQ